MPSTARSSMLRQTFRAILFTVILLVAFGSAFCRFRKEPPPKPPMAKCLDDLKRIPEISALMGNQKRADSDQARPLEGVEIALTINEMVSSVSRPDDDIDYWCENENSLANLNKLIGALQTNRMPPTVAFIVGQTADNVTLTRWLESGNLLGNMTFSRLKIRRQEPQPFFADVIKNDNFLAPLLAQYNIKQKYFRYPRSKVSRDTEFREQIRDFLKSQNYTEAVAMIETPDWQFSDIYCAAQSRGDATCVNLIKESFKTLLLDTAIRTHQAARNKTERNARLILSLSMNQFTCDSLGEWLVWLQNLGVRFISLDEALTDAVYRDFDDKGRPLFQAILRTAQRSRTMDSKAK